MEKYMKKEKMLTLDLIGHGLDYRFNVPESIFFDLVEIVPQLVECIGFEQSKIDYSEMLEDIREKYQLMDEESWDSTDNETQVLLRKCLIIAVLGGLLHDIPLMICSNNAVELMEGLGGINITDQVESGALPFLSSKESDMFKQRCSQ